VWAEARKTAHTEAQFRSPLGRRPYDLLHAAVSLWLNSGVPATEIARRARHGVAVLLKIFAHCIDGQTDAPDQRITDDLGAKDAGPEPVTSFPIWAPPGREGAVACERRPCPSVRRAAPSPWSTDTERTAAAGNRAS
jgi:hypothetical protein